MITEKDTPIQIITNTDLIGMNQEVAIFQPMVLTADTPVIMALHGNWSTYRRNEFYGKFFSRQGYLVVAPTFRHHYKGNESEVELGKTSVRDYAADAALLIDKLYQGQLIAGFQPTHQPVLMGHSMGGLVAQLIATQKFISGLILLNSAPPAGLSLHTDAAYHERIKKFDKLILGGKPYLPDFESMAWYVFNGMPAESHQSIYEKAVCESGTSSREILAGSGRGLPRLMARLLSQPVEIDPEWIACPMLIVGCERDRIIKPIVAKEMGRKYSGRTALTKVKVFPQFAHWVQYEPGWEESAMFIFGWLKGQETRQ